MSVRRLAAIDMYGGRGTLLRRRLVLVEFVAAVLICLALSVLLIVRGGSASSTVVGAWVALLGANYVPLALYAVGFSRGSHLEHELEGVDTAQELRYYSVAQFWVLVPFVFVVLAFVESSKRG